MSPSFQIDVDPSRSLLRIKLAGFFDLETLDRFVAARNAAVQKLSCGPNQHITLCDVSESKLSTQEIVDEFRKVIADPLMASRRLAFAIGRSLARMQLRRIALRDNIGFFEDIASAEAWLLSETP